MKFLTFLYDSMADFELTLPSTAVGMWSGNEVISFSLDGQIVKGMSGQSYTPDYDVKSVLDLEGIDGLIIPGGMNIYESDDLMLLINKLNRQKKLLAAICAGPEYLARAGVLESVKYTTSKSKEHFDGNDPFPWDNYKEEKVVRDDHVITAKGVNFVEFGIELMDYIGSFKTPEEKLMTLKEFSL